MTDEGRLVAGRYRLRTRLGAGAMGVVWQAFDERLGRVVALKQLVVPEGADAGEAVRRAAREGRIAARLQHPNAVTVHDVVEEDGRPVLVMEYVAARTLAELGVLAPGRAARVGAQVASALAAAHAAGIVHRDVKPGNVLITADGTAKITDFGIARAVGDVAVTRTGLLAGTPAFLSPEVARGGEPGPASDVFSLGATLYAAVEGRPPFGDGDNAIALLHTVASGRFAPPAHAGPLTGLLMDMLRTDPAARPTMAQVAGRLAAGPTTVGPTTVGPTTPGPTLTGPPLTGPPVAGATLTGPPAATRLDLPPARTGRALPVAVAALVVLGVVVAVVLVVANRDDGTTAAPTGSSAAPTTTTTTTGSTVAVPPERVVADYYALLPDQVGQAWAMLGPGARSQGRERFEKAWRGVSALSVTTPPAPSGPDTVTVGISYAKGSEVVTETRRHRVVVRDGTPLIESDEVLSSQRVEREDDKKRGKDEDKDRDRGKGEDEDEGG